MRSPRMHVGALVVTTGALFAGLSVGAVAHATSCPSGYHCVYKDTLDDLQQKDYFAADSSFSNDNFANSGGVVNDNTSAARNSSNGNYRSRYYYDVNQLGGAVFCVNPLSYVGQLSTDGIKGNNIGRNDEASSIDLASGSLTGCF